MRGTYTVYYTVTDEEGSTAEEANRVVVVKDTVAPTLQLLTCAGRSEIEGHQNCNEADIQGFLPPPVNDSGGNVNCPLQAENKDAQARWPGKTWRAGFTSPSPPDSTQFVFDISEGLAPNDSPVAMEIQLEAAFQRAKASDTGVSACDIGAGVAVGEDSADWSAVHAHFKQLPRPTTGVSEIVYTIADRAKLPTNRATVRRQVRLVDRTPPAIAVVGGLEQRIEVNNHTLPLSQNKSGIWTAPAIDIVDVVDGSIADYTVIGGDVVNTTAPGSYNVTFSAVDSSGNKGTATLMVRVEDTLPPTINLAWPSDAAETTSWKADAQDNLMQVNFGTVWVDPGWTVFDASGEALDNLVQLQGISVNTSAEVGTVFELVYTVKDSAGNAASMPPTRRVEIVDTLPPQIVLFGVTTAVVPHAGSPSSNADADPGYGYDDDGNGDGDNAEALQASVQVLESEPRPTLQRVLSVPWGGSSDFGFVFTDLHDTLGAPVCSGSLSRSHYAGGGGGGGGGDDVGLTVPSFRAPSDASTVAAGSAGDVACVVDASTTAWREHVIDLSRSDFGRLAAWCTLGREACTEQRNKHGAFGRGALVVAGLGEAGIPGWTGYTGRPTLPFRTSGRFNISVGMIDGSGNFEHVSFLLTVSERTLLSKMGGAGGVAGISMVMLLVLVFLLAGGT